MWAALFYTSVGCIDVENWAALLFICGLHYCRYAGCIDVYNSGLHSIFSLYMFLGFCVLCCVLPCFFCMFLGFYWGLHEGCTSLFESQGSDVVMEDCDGVMYLG